MASAGAWDSALAGQRGGKISGRKYLLLIRASEDGKTDGDAAETVIVPLDGSLNQKKFCPWSRTSQRMGMRVLMRTPRLPPSVTAETMELTCLIFG
jgi:hypothetical protein